MKICSLYVNGGWVIVGFVVFSLLEVLKLLFSKIQLHEIVFIHFCKENSQLFQEVQVWGLCNTVLMCNSYSSDNTFLIQCWHHEGH